MLLYIETYTSFLPTDRITYCQMDGALKNPPRVANWPHFLLCQFWQRWPAVTLLSSVVTVATETDPLSGHSCVTRQTSLAERWTASLNDYYLDIPAHQDRHHLLKGGKNHWMITMTINCQVKMLRKVWHWSISAPCSVQTRSKQNCFVRFLFLFLIRPPHKQAPWAKLTPLKISSLTAATTFIQ